MRSDWCLARNVVFKALGLFVGLNLLWGLTNPLPHIASLSAYNVIFPGRLRLPYSQDPGLDYQVTLSQFDAMFASHIIATRKAVDEYRVLVIGDSSVWGVRLLAGDTLVGNLNAAHLTTSSGRVIRAYNLGYPYTNLTKDVLLLEYAMRYQPDMVVWLVALDAFEYKSQLSHPLVQANPDKVKALILRYHLNLDQHDPIFATSPFLQRTLIGQRAQVADILHLQFYGVLWAATGIDHIAQNLTPFHQDLSNDPVYKGIEPPKLSESDLALDVFAAGLEIIGHVPLLLVNEPIFIGLGSNSDVRYNSYYPRWAYDQYRVILARYSETHGLDYLDLWNAMPGAAFNGTPLHLSPAGNTALAALIGPAICEQANQAGRR